MCIRDRWKEHCKRVQSITDTALLAGETPAQKDRRILRLQGNYAAVSYTHLDVYKRQILLILLNIKYRVENSILNVVLLC